MIAKRFSKGLILAVCIVLVFAVAAALLFDNGATLPANDNVIADTGEGADEVAEASYPVSADGYTHGSNVKNNTTAQPVNTASGLISAIQNNTTIRLTGLITLSADDVKKIWNYTYSGTIYGNGQTIEATFPSSENASSVDPSSHVSAYGGLCGKLTGNIYDLTYVHTGGQLNVRMSGNNSGFAGGLVGSVDGGTIENVRLELSYDDGGRVGFVKTSSGSGWGSTNYYVAAGALAGRISAGNIKNVTIVNNAWIEAGVTNGTTNVSTKAPGHVGNVAGIIGPVQDDIVTTGSIDIDNVIVEGYDSRSPKMYGDYVANIGTVTTSSLEITVTNFYNGYKNLYDGNASTPTFLKEGTSPTLAITNMYNAKEVTSGTRNDCNISNSITVDPSNATSGYSTGYTVGFDPKADSVENSLVVYKSGITSGQDYTATIKAANNTTYSDNYAFNEAGNTVIFRNLPTAISNWGGNGGTFSCTINITQDAIQVDELDPVNKWESSYTTTTSSTGTAVDNGSKLTTAINNNQNIYLTSDITDFKGFTHTDEYTGTLDGNGHTIYIVSGTANSSDTVGGLFKRLSGTIKNVRIVLYNSYDRTIGTEKIGTGIVAGNLCGGTVENVYVYIPDGVTFGADGGTTYESYVGAVAGLSDAGCTIKNTTVHLDGKLHLNGTYVYLAGFVGKGSTSASQTEFNMTNNVFKGSGSFASEKSISTEPIYLAATTVLFQSGTGDAMSTINIDGFVNAFKGGTANLNDYSMYGVLSKNDNGKNMSKWTKNVSNVYDYDSPWADINNKGTDSTGNNYIDVTNSRSTVSTTVEGSSIKVTPYFPADSKYDGKLVLVAGDGSVSVPEVAYNGISGETDGNYKVVTVAKNDISAGSTVTLTEPVIPATPIEPLNEWENGYAVSSDVVPDGYTAVADGTQLANAIAANENIFLTADIMDYVGFNGASETDGGYSGIFDGNGHTVYIVKANTVSKQYVGGLFGKLKGTVKDVRIVVMAGVDLPSTTYVGAVAGALSGNANVSNVNVIINSGVNLVISGSSSNVGGAGGIAGGLTSGSGETVTISNSTVVLNGTLKATAQYTFIAGFVGHLNGGSVNYTDLTFKGNGMLDGVANAGEGVHTAGAGIVGGGVSAVNVNGFINSFNGSLSNGRSAYEVVVRNSQSTSISVNVSNVYTYGTVTTYDGSMDYGKPVACDKSTIATTVADTQIPVTPYFPVTNSGELVLVAGDGKSECPFVTYESYEGMQDGKYMVVSIPKAEITASSTVQLIQGKSPVSDPTLATTEEELVYKGGEITIAINQLMSGTTALGESDYTVVITENGGNALVQNGKPVNAGEYTLTVTLLNGYEFEDGMTEKTIPFTVTPFVISGSLAVSGSAVYDKTEKTVIFTADENKGLFNGDNVVISYNDGDRVNVTEAGFVATATVPNGNYTFADGDSISATLKITAKELTVVWGNTSFTYDGNEKAPTADVTEGVIDGDDVTLAVSGAVAAAGQDYIATATISPENANYTLTNDTVQFSIAKAKVSVSGKDVTVEYKAAEYTEEEIKAAVFADGMPDVATTTITVSPASVINAGDSATVTVALIDGDNYEFEAGTTTQFTFSVTAKEISLPVESANKSAVYSPSTSYNAAQITELIFGTASIENVTITVKSGEVEIGAAVSDAGIYTVTAAANANYVFAAETVTEYTFEITKAPITLGVSVSDWIYGNQASAPVITGNDGNGEVTYLYTGTDYSDAVAPTKAGTYTLTTTVAETANYQGGKASCEFTIEKATVTVPTIEDKVYTGEPLVADVSETDYYEVTKNDGGSEVATYEVVLTLKDADNYKWSDGTETAEITLEFHIVASGNSWTTPLSIVGWTYGKYSADVNAPVYKAEKGNDTAVVEVRLKTGTDADYDTVTDLSTLGAGDYYMRVRVPKTEEYGGLSAVVEFTVSKAAISVTVSIDGWTYGDVAKEPSVSGNTAGGAVTYFYEGTGDTVYAASETAPKNAGTYKVTATVAETANYLGKTANTTFAIAEKAIIATVSAQNATYDGMPHAATVVFDGKVGDDDLTANLLYNGEADVPANAGSYIVTVGSYGGAAVDNYDITTAEGEVTLVISAKELTTEDLVVMPVDENEDGVYDGEAHAIVASVDEGALCRQDDVVTLKVLYGGSETAPVNAGTYTVTFEITDNGNYVLAEGTGFELTVKQAKVSLSGEDKTAEYKGEAYSEEEIKNAVFGEGNWTDFNIEISYNNTAALNAGDVATVTVTGYDDPNYTLDPETTKSFSFTVTTLKVAAPALVGDVFVYNGGAQSVSLVDDAYVAISDNSQTDKGDYNAVVTLKDKNNYEWTTGGNEDVELPWSISAKEITLKAETSVNKTYDGEAYDFSEYTVSGAKGFFERDNVTVTVSAGEIYTPGSYGITVSHNANGNYDVAVEPTEAVLTIAKATLIITANPAEKEYTGNDLTFDFDIAGVIGADDVSIDTVTYKKDGAIATPNAIGLYVAEFALKGAHASYYNANSVEVTVKAPTTDAPDDMSADNIILPQGELFYDGQAHNATLNYTSSDGNTYGLVYYFNGSPVENVVNAGTYTVMIYKNSQIYIIEGIEKQLTVLPRVLTADDVSLPQNTTYTYSGAEFDVSVTAKGVNNETVTLASLYDGASEKPVNAGEYAVTFVSSDSNYTVAENVGVTITISRKPFDKPSQPQLTYTGQEQTAFYDTDGYSVGGVFAATDVSVDGYTASFTLKNENYKWSGEDDSVRVVDVVWKISPATVVVTASGAETSKTYDGVALSEEELKALFTAPDKLDGTGKVAVSVTVEGGLEVLNADEYTVIAVVNDVNYVPEETRVTFTVLKADPVVKAAVKDRLLQDGDKLSVVTVYLQEGSTAGTIAWDDPDTTLVKGNNVVTWTFVPDDGINYNGDSGEITLVVGDEVLTGLVLTQAPDKTAYNALDDFDPTGMIVTATFDDQYEQVVTDECEITVENAAEGGKISGATKRVVAEYGNMKVYVEITVTLLTVEIPALDKTETEYNASVQSVTVEENSLYEIVDGNTGVDVGTYKLKLGLTDKVNYVWSDGTSENKELSWKITPVTISGEIVLPDNLVFDGSAKEATFRLVQGTLYGDAQTGISYELPDGTKLGGAPSEAGVYEVVATLPDTVNYRFATDTEYSVSMTIQKRVISITTIGSREKVYDGIEVTEEQLAEFFSATDGIKINVKVDGTVLDAGTYEITATIDSPNYTAEPVVCTYTVRKASKAISATLNVGYLKLDVSVNGDDTSVEYSLDGNVWAPLDGEIAVGLQEKYTVWVRYGESKNYVEGTPVKLEKNITVEALAQYVEERFEGDATLADVKDIELLERLAAAATGSDAELEARVAELSEQKETLVNGASSAVEKALKIGGRLRGYAGAAASVAVALGGIAIAAALGITVKSRKGGRKNEE